jgi:hypothetical protein
MWMIDIGEFAREAATQFEGSQKEIPEQFDLNLPREAVENLIKASYYASQLPDEGRWPCVTLMGYRKGCENQFHVWFQKSFDVVPEDIAKLAHAVTDDSHIACISDGGRLRIEGFHINRLYDRKDLGYASFRTANPLKVSIRGPGHVDISFGGTAIVYKAGEMSEEALFQHCGALKQLAALVERELQDLTTGTVESVEDILNDVAKAIVKLGHGGLLLFAEQQGMDNFLSCKTVDVDLLQRLLVEYWDSVKKLRDASGGLPQLIVSEPQEAWSKESLVVARNTDMLEKCVRTIAQFAGMDGAIVFKYDCRVGAFNAIIKRRDCDATKFRFLDGAGRPLTYDGVTKNRGARHQSALSFVMAVPMSFAFVISQDGLISAFHNPGDKTIWCERGMRALE